MPYVRKTGYKRNRTTTTTSGGRNSSGSTSTAARNAKRAKTNYAVRRKLRKPFVPVAIKNTDGIRTLARQVRALQVQRIGDIQKSIQHFNITPGPITTAGITYSFEENLPLLFALNDPRVGSSILCPHPTNGARTTLGLFAKHNFESNVAGQSNGSSYSYHTGVYDDLVSMHQYMPVSTTITVSCDLKPQAAQDTTLFRMDFFTVKKVMLHSAQHNLQLPTNIGALGNFAHRDISKRNWFNKKYFNCLGTKYMSFTPHDTSQTPGLRTINMTMKHFFKPKVLQPDMESTREEDGTTHTADGIWGGIPQDEVVWCMISSNRSHVSSHMPRFTISRHISWRDNEGVAT